ncbi:MAG: polysaccharide deacetylase family protein, partial [Vicinamibacterales bacterium]
MTSRNRLPHWRGRLKEGAAFVISRVATTNLRRRNRHGYRPLVLGYHRVVEDFDAASATDMPSMLISTAMFERHLDLIGRRFRFVGIDEIGDTVRNGVPFEEPVAAVTFDDGYQDVFDNAVPILTRKGIPAASFVVTDLIGRSAWQTHDKLYHLVEKAFTQWSEPRSRLRGVLRDLGLDESTILRDGSTTQSPLMTVSALLPNLSRVDALRVMGRLEWLVGNGFVGVPQTMSWEVLKQMRRDGFIIGSHTRTHVSLPMESTESAVDELSDSKRLLEQHLGEPIDHFAYPGGQFTPAVVEAIEQCGYRYAYTACSHADDRYPALTIERLLLWERSSIDTDGRFYPAILDCQAQN